MLQTWNCNSILSIFWVTFVLLIKTKHSTLILIELGEEELFFLNFSFLLTVQIWKVFSSIKCAKNYLFWPFSWLISWNGFSNVAQKKWNFMRDFSQVDLFFSSFGINFFSCFSWTRIMMMSRVDALIQDDGNIMQFSLNK